MAFAGDVAGAARTIAPRVSVIDASELTKGTAEMFAKGQVGNDLFKIHSQGAIERLAAAEGPEMGARYVRFNNGEVAYVTAHPEQVAVDEGKRGVFGLGSRAPKTETRFRYVKRDEPTPPPPPSASEIVSGKIKLLQGKANDLVQSSKKLGTKKHEAMQQATMSQTKAKEYLGHAKEFLKAGDKDSAIDALYKVVTQSQRGDSYADMAKIVGAQQSELMKQVAQFRTGLEKVALSAELKSVNIDAAKAMNDVKKEMTGLGSDATTLKEQLSSMDNELANLQAENSAMDEMIANGEVDSLFGDPLAARAEQSSADDSVRALLENLMADIQVENTAATTTESAIGATTASETVATEAKTMTA